MYVPQSRAALSLLGFCYYHLQDYQAAADWYIYSLNPLALPIATSNTLTSLVCILPSVFLYFTNQFYLHQNNATVMSSWFNYIQMSIATSSTMLSASTRRVSSPRPQRLLVS